MKQIPIIDIIQLVLTIILIGVITFSIVDRSSIDKSCVARYANTGKCAVLADKNMTVNFSTPPTITIETE